MVKTEEEQEEAAPPRDAKPAAAAGAQPSLEAVTAALRQAGASVAEERAEEAKKRKQEKEAAAASAKGSGGAKRSRGEAAPEMPKKIGDYVHYRGSRISHATSKWHINIPKSVCKTNKDWSGDRVFGKDKRAAFDGCVQKIDEMTGCE